MSNNTSVDPSTLELEQLFGLFIGLLSGKAWEYMGLRLPPGKSEPEKDLVKASITIDTIEFMVDKLVPSMSKDEAERIRSMVSDLKLNYARQA
jgi:hypothetical protein